MLPVLNSGSGSKPTAESNKQNDKEKGSRLSLIKMFIFKKASKTTIIYRVTVNTRKPP
jgi:hypothetical protein